MHLQPSAPMAMQPAGMCQVPMQQVQVPVPVQAQTPELPQATPEASQPVEVATTPQASPSVQLVDTLPKQASKEEKRENPAKSAQTEVSSGSTREESVAECTTDAESDSDSDEMPERPPVPEALAEALAGLTNDPCVV